jgi:hypothetical protein
LAEFNSLRDELFASGYLTNISITVSNASQHRSQLVKRLGDATRGKDILICKFTIQSNEVIIMTLPSNAAIFEKAFHE